MDVSWSHCLTYKNAALWLWSGFGFSWQQKLKWGIRSESLLEQWSQKAGEEWEIWDGDEGDNLRVHFYGHCDEQGASSFRTSIILLLKDEKLVARHHLLRFISGVSTSLGSWAAPSGGPAVFSGPGTECKQLRGTFLKWDASGVRDAQICPFLQRLKSQGRRRQGMWHRVPEASATATIYLEQSWYVKPVLKQSIYIFSFGRRAPTKQVLYLHFIAEDMQAFRG